MDSGTESLIRAQMYYAVGNTGFAAKTQGHSCGCVGPQNGNPVCPCQMPAYREREEGKKALAFLRAVGKPRFRVKAGRGGVS